MAYGSISAKQQEILNYIKSEIIDRGYPPAVRDICEAVHLKSTSSFHAHLEALEKNGYIRKDPTKPRAIEVVDEGFNAVRRELVNVPLVGTVAAGQPLLAVENIESYFPVPAESWPPVIPVVRLSDISTTTLAFAFTQSSRPVMPEWVNVLSPITAIAGC